jgi:aspartate/methionine/tyrosine aminotransferase
MQQVALNMRSSYIKRRDRVLRIAEECGSKKVFAKAPMGAFYFFLDMRPLGMSSTQICERILEEAGVGLVPGAAFGQQGEGFVRMTTAASDDDVEAGFRKIIEWADKVQG